MTVKATTDPLPATATGASQSRQMYLAIGALWLIFAWYAVFWLTLGSFDLLKGEPEYGLVFNNMLEHLLAGRFDIDPAVIGPEAFIRDHHTYAYFGIFCALLRAPLLLFGALRSTDVSVLSMAVAVSLQWLFRLIGLTIVYRSTPRWALSRTLFVIVVLSIMLGGESIQFLKPTVYQEVVTWATTLECGFIVLLLRLLLVPGAHRVPLFCGMALIAGLALMTRATAGLGLYLALGFMFCVEIFRNARDRQDLLRFLLSPQLLGPAAILLLFAVLVGFVNFERWGNPLATADFMLYAKNHTVFLDHIPRLRRYGEFSFARVPYGLLYYFAPLGVYPGTGGALLRMMDGIDLPPGSLFLSDPATCLLAGFGLYRLARPGKTMPLPFYRPFAVAALAALAVPALLVLAFLYFSFRYRGEFYPFLDFAACLGLALVMRLDAERLSGWRNALLVAGVVGAIVSHVSLFAYILTPVSPTNDLDMSHGVVGVYRAILAGRSPLLGYHLMPPGQP
jgi:hypothetical protein